MSVNARDSLFTAVINNPSGAYSRWVFLCAARVASVPDDPG
jgi:hypothetical protein